MNRRTKVSRILKKYNLRREYLKLEEEDVRNELSSYSKEFEKKFNKYFKSDAGDRTIWVNQETGDVIDHDPSDIEKLKEDHIKAEEAKEKERIKKIRESRNKSEKVKRLYKQLASHLHPDKGGSDDDFQKLSKYYKSNDLIQMLSLAGDYGLDYEIDKSDEVILDKNLGSIESEILRMKDTLAWLWSTGGKKEKMVVLARIEHITGKPIDKNDFKDLFESE